MNFSFFLQTLPVFHLTLSLAKAKIKKGYKTLIIILINLDKIMEQNYLTIKEAAKILGVTPLTLRNWDKSGRLKAYRNPINNYRVYKPEQIELLLRTIESRAREKKKIFLG